MASSSSDKNSILVVVAGRPYPLRVEAQEEGDVRALVKEINERFNDFQVKFSDRDTQDCLVMTLLTYADELRSARNLADTSLDGELAHRLKALDAIVEGML
ncbi:cell division protein ZapA [Neolewinella aurantiaca]|uniref:Cell division protein ZapA n=1 Tax=Neolewinella aurantiaca TaxID=2602767 RepID=A0A5C7FI78_9BACT|nr:cell division protein ZapA [Neolewinella aurantiaca]TXF89456.1 cell division protein ZapA [Neolewinella aurantiaca]